MFVNVVLFHKDLYAFGTVVVVGEENKASTLVMHAGSIHILLRCCTGTWLLFITSVSPMGIGQPYLLQL